MILKGCQEGKATPKLIEIRCPKCKNDMEVFVRMGGGIGQTGKIVSEEICDCCGYRIVAESSIEGFEKI